MLFVNSGSYCVAPRPSSPCRGIFMGWQGAHLRHLPFGGRRCSSNSIDWTVGNCTTNNLYYFWTLSCNIDASESVRWFKWSIQGRCAKSVELGTNLKARFEAIYKFIYINKLEWLYRWTALLQLAAPCIPHACFTVPEYSLSFGFNVRTLWRCSWAHRGHFLNYVITSAAWVFSGCMYHSPLEDQHGLLCKPLVSLVCAAARATSCGQSR